LLTYAENNVVSKPQQFDGKHYITGCAVAQALCWRRHIIPMGASRDFLTFFPAHTWRSDPQPIFTQNGSDDMDSRKYVPFAVKIATFHTP